jgi:hypothetical protein
MSDRYRANRFKPQVDPDNYAAIAAALKAAQTRSATFGPGYEEIPAPTRGLGRARAWKCGYNRNTGTLVIIMRDYTWIEYDEVPEEMWDSGLKVAQSTNEFVQEALLNWPYVKTDFGKLPRTKPESFNTAIEANQGYYNRYGQNGPPIQNY